MTVTALTVTVLTVTVLTVTVRGGGEGGEATVTVRGVGDVSQRRSTMWVREFSKTRSRRRAVPNIG